MSEPEKANIKGLKDKRHYLELKMAKVMLELLEELDTHKDDDRTLDGEVKEGIKNLTNKIFELQLYKGE